MILMRASDFADKCKTVAEDFNTVYCKGMFGWSINDAAIRRAVATYSAWYNQARVLKLKNLEGKDFFGFDCVCLIKGILWGWNGNKSALNGGAIYASNGVPDMGADNILDYCKGVSDDFKDIAVGEVVWTTGHVGVYIGNGNVVECTAKWGDNGGSTVISALANIGAKGKYTRAWKKHGKLPWLDYEVDEMTKEEISALIDKKITERLQGLNIDCPAWALDSWNNAIAEGITDGTRPEGYAKRDEVVAMIGRAKG